MKIIRRVQIVIIIEILFWVFLLAVSSRMGCPQSIIALFLLSGLCLIFITYFEIYVPQKELDDAIHNLTEGEYSEEQLIMYGARNYELDSIVKMVEHYSMQRTRQNSAKIFDKQTQLTALQSQINPHFLYNTLESIRGQALIDENYEIARMVEALGAFFRYSISRKGNLVTLRDELANINNYMLIQRYRFNNRFSLEVLIDEEDEKAYDFLIPRLIIQPVVENAIFHGLEERMEEGIVTIEVIVTDSTLILMISDNGCGIDGNTLKKLNDRIHSPSGYVESNRDSAQRNTGIALPNIHKRIQLLFGKEYGLNVYSTVGQGTDVEIMIPADYKRKEDWKDED